MKKALLLICFLWIFSGCHFEDRVPIDMVSINQTQPLGDEKSLDSTIHFDIGSLEITNEADAATLYSMELLYDRASYEPEIDYDAPISGEEGRFRFSLDSTHKVGIRREKHNNRLRLAFNESLPLTMRVTTGIGDARLSLSRLKLQRLQFESGVGGAKISAYEPNAIECERIKLENGVGSIEAVGLGNLNFRELEFEGGVGGANLDFTGEWKQDADISIAVGVGGVNLRIPRELGVKVEAEKHFLSGLHLEGFNQRGSAHYSKNYDTAVITLSIRVTTGIGGLKITWI
jgi:hypothetical protein